MNISEGNRFKVMKKAYDGLAEATEQEADVLYKAIEDNFMTFKNTQETAPKQVWLVHDALYFSKKIAEIFEDGKDDAREMFIIVQADEEVTEGACYHPLYDSEENAWIQIEEDTKQL